MHQALDEFLRSTQLGPKLNVTRVFRAWQQAVGPKLAARALPVRFESGKLSVEVDSAAHLHELANFSGERYRRAANQRLGHDSIQRVVFQAKT